MTNLLRYPLKTDWVFYLFVLSYAFLIVSMTGKLWFGTGVNIFASYTDVETGTQFIVDANKVYWSKTCFLFGILLLTALRLDFRTAVGIGAVFWSTSLILMFGVTLNLSVAFILGLAMVVLQIFWGQFLGQS